MTLKKLMNDDEEMLNDVETITDEEMTDEEMTDDEIDDEIIKNEELIDETDDEIDDLYDDEDDLKDDENEIIKSLEKEQKKEKKKKVQLTDEQRKKKLMIIIKSKKGANITEESLNNLSKIKKHRKPFKTDLYGKEITRVEIDKMFEKIYNICMKYRFRELSDDNFLDIVYGNSMTYRDYKMEIYMKMIEDKPIELYYIDYELFYTNLVKQYSLMTMRTLITRYLSDETGRGGLRDIKNGKNRYIMNSKDGEKFDKRDNVETSDYQEKYNSQYIAKSILEELREHFIEKSEEIIKNEMKMRRQNIETFLDELLMPQNIVYLLGKKSSIRTSLKREYDKKIENYTGIKPKQLLQSFIDERSERLKKYNN